MAEFVIKDGKVFLAGYDLSGDVNAAAIDYSADALDVTCLGDSTHIRIGGIKTVTAQVEGYYDGTDNDQQLFSRIGTADVPLTICPQDANEGSRAYTFKTMVASYSPGGSLGEAMTFSVSGEATGYELVQGVVLLNGTKTVTGNGTGQLLTAVTATQQLFAALHITAVGDAAAALVVKIQSDDNSGFTTPVDRITFTSANAIGAQWATPVNGPITDTYWRAVWTITGGTTPSFTFIVPMGIQ